MMTMQRADALSYLLYPYSVEYTGIAMSVFWLLNNLVQTEIALQLLDRLP